MHGLTRRILIAGVLAALSLLPAGAPGASPAGNRADRINQLIQQNNLEEAEALAQQWVDVEPSPHAWYNLGLVLFAEKKYIEAYPVLERALQSTLLEIQVTARIYEMLGRIDWHFKRYDPAITRIKDASLLPGLPADTRERLEKLHREVLNEKGFTTWLRRDTPAIEFYYPTGPGTLAAIDGVVQEYSAVVDNFVKAFGTPPEPRIKFYFYGDPEYFHLIHPGQAHTFIYLREQGIHGFPEPRLKHEFYHLLIYRLRNRNYPSYVVSEGFAEFLRRRDSGESPHAGAAAMLATRGLPPFAQIDQLDPFESDLPWAWDVVASFTAHLVERHGMDKYLALWNSAEGLAKDCPAVFGAPFEEVYRQWVESLRAMPLPDDVRWAPLEEELLTPGLYADALAALDRVSSGADRRAPFLRARALAGLGRYDEALAEIRRLGEGPLRGEGLTPAARGAALVLAGRLHDIAGERAVALACYQAALGLAESPASVRDDAALGLKTPCRAVDFPRVSAPDAVRRAERIVNFRIRTGLASADLVAAVLAGLDADKFKRLFRDLEPPLKRRGAWLKEAAAYPRGLDRPDKFAAEWDRYSAGPVDLAPAREILRQDLDGFVPERCVAKIRAAGISIVDIAECVD